MKLINLKKATSYSIALLTIFSSIGILNCAKVSALPEVSNSQCKRNYSTENDFIKFTHLDLDDLVNSQPTIPNLDNLTRKDRNLNHWVNSAEIYLQTVTEIITTISSPNIKGKLDENLTENDIDEILHIDTLNVGNLLDQIRRVLIRDDITQETKNENYLNIVIKFLNLKFRSLNIIKERLNPRIEKFNNVKITLLKLLKKSSETGDIGSIKESIEKIGKNNPEEEIEIIVKIIKNIVIARNHASILKTDLDYWENKRKPLYEEMEKIKNYITDGQKIKLEEIKPDKAKLQKIEKYISLSKEYKIIMEEELKVAANKELADYALLRATEKTYLIEEIPTRMLMEEITKYNL